MGQHVDAWPRYTNSTGAPYASGTIYFGKPNVDTKLNPITVYSASDKTGSLGNSVSLDSEGKTTSAVYVFEAYSYRVEDSAGDLVETVAYNEPLLTDSLTSLPDYGAVGDGTTDDTTAINTALAAGVPLDGRGKTYGVSGNITLPAGTNLSNATFKQLTPAATSSVRTLESSGVDNIRLVNVTVDKNGVGTEGDPSSAAGVWISGGTGHYLENVSVFGASSGMGIHLTGVSETTVIRPHCYDLSFDDTGATSEQVNAFRLDECNGVQVVAPLIENLSGNVAGRPQRYTRGIVLGGAENVDINSPVVDTAGQGVDITGAGSLSKGYNRAITINGGKVSNIDSYGYKVANNSRAVRVMGAQAENCGYAGFVCNEGSSASPNGNRDNMFIGCRSLNAGSNGFWSGNNPAGFLLLGTNYPKNVQFINCDAEDDQGTATMVDGFRNQITAANAGNDNLLRVINCRSSGETGDKFDGFHTPVVRVLTNTDVSISDSTWTAVTWDLNNSDTSDMHDTATNNSRVTVTRSGWYEVTPVVTFVANATGEREARIAVDGSNIGRTNVYGVTDASIPTTMYPKWLGYLNAGQYVEVEVRQTSGGALDVDASHSSMLLKQID